MGYEEVETSGLDPEALTYIGLPVKEFAKRLQDHNLVDAERTLRSAANSSTEAPTTSIVTSISCAEGARILGQRYIVWP